MPKLNLIVVAHPDDEILGFGGTGNHLVSKGEVVQPVILCGEVNARNFRPKDHELHQDIARANDHLGFSSPVLGDFPNIRMNNVDHIALVQFIEKQIAKFQPSRIFTHHPCDLNNDHLETSKACVAAARYFQRTERIQELESLYFIEVLSSTDWSFPAYSEPFKPDCFVDISETLKAKLEALELYRNVMRKPPHPRSHEAVSASAVSRGSQSGYKFAEAFQTVLRRGL